MRRHETEAAGEAGQRRDSHVVALPIETLVPHPRNARRGDLDLLVESLRAHGQYAPLVAQASTRRVLRGNHLLAAAKILGWSELTVQLIDVDDEQALRILLIDNRASDRASYDVDRLVELLASLPTLEATGYGDDDLAQLLDQLQLLDADRRDDRLDDEEHDRDDDEQDDNEDGRVGRRESSITIGDIFLLGEHRIHCGDPRDPYAWERLLGSERLGLLIIHPPETDDTDEAAQQLADSLAAADLSVAPGACVLLFRHQGAHGINEVAALSSRWQYLQECVHLHTPIETNMTFPVAHEPIVLAQKTAATAAAPTNRTGSTSAWTTDTPADVAVNALTDPGMSIAVLYPMNADALLACDRGRRIAHLMQPNPRILESIVETWQEAGGAPLRRHKS